MPPDSKRMILLVRSQSWDLPTFKGRGLHRDLSTRRRQGSVRGILGSVYHTAPSSPLSPFPPHSRVSPTPTAPTATHGSVTRTFVSPTPATSFRGDSPPVYLILPPGCLDVSKGPQRVPSHSLPPELQTSVSVGQRGRILEHLPGLLGGVGTALSGGRPPGSCDSRSHPTPTPSKQAAFSGPPVLAPESSGSLPLLPWGVFPGGAACCPPAIYGQVNG